MYLASGVSVFARNISQYPHQPCMDLTGQSVEMEIFCSDLKLTPCMKLVLDGCSLGDKEAIILGHGIRNAPKLQVLKCSFNCIGDVGAKGLANGIKHCPELKLVDASFNEIGDDGAIAIASAARV